MSSEKESRDVQQSQQRIQHGEIQEYIPPAPAFTDLKSAHKFQAHERKPAGIKTHETLIMMACEVALLIAYGLLVNQEKVPKQPVPNPGPGDNPALMDMVVPFKRYPPGFDNYYGSAAYNQYKLQEHYSSFMQISIFTFLSMPWSFAFLRKFSYSSSTFALFTACVSIQFGILVMQMVDRVHCYFLDGLLQTPEFPVSAEMLAAVNVTDLTYTCQLFRPFDNVEDSFGLRQLRQGCYCRLWASMSQNYSLYNFEPLLGAHALLVTGHRDFRPFSFSLDMIDIVDGMFSTVPTLISFGVLVGKMAPVQNVVLVFMNVLAYAFNYWLCIYVLGAFDGTGGSTVTHTFGAFFGAACTAIASPKDAWRNPDCKGRYQSEILSLFGTLLIWAYYPSYNSFYAPPNAQQAVAINTYLALLGSSIAGLLASAIFTGHLKLNIFDAQRSSIAGGVAMGSIANLVAKPWEATLIGAVGGFACSFAGRYLRVFLNDRLNIHDTVGVMSMHAWPGMVGWLSGVIYLIPLSLNDLTGDLESATLDYYLPWEDVLQHNAGTGDAAIANVLMLPLTISIALTTGILAGAIAKKVTTLAPDLLFKDDSFFYVPDDFSAKIEFEDSDEEGHRAEGNDNDESDDEVGV